MQLRLATPDDAEGIAEVYRPYVTGTTVTFELEPPSPEEMAKRISVTMPRYPWLVCVDSKVRGYACATRLNDRPAYAWSVDTAIYLSPDVQGRGWGRRLYGALLELLTAQGYWQAFAQIASPNVASEKLHLLMGYRHVGAASQVGFKFGEWRDVGWWQRSLQDGIDSPKPVRTLNELEPKELEAALRVAG